MRIYDIAEWLRTSILGIIILGAFGSLLAVILLRLLGTLFRKLPPYWWLISFIPFASRGFFDPWFYQKLKEENDVQSLLVYLIYNSVRCILYFLNSLLFSGATYFLFSKMDMVRLTWGSYISFILAVLFMLAAFIELLSLHEAYNVFIGSRYKERIQLWREVERDLVSDSVNDKPAT